MGSSPIVARQGRGGEEEWRGKLTRYGQGLKKNFSDLGLWTLNSIFRTLTILRLGLVLHVHTMQALILSCYVETNPGPGSDNEKSIIWDDGKCVGESRSTPTSQKWLFRQEMKQRRIKRAAGFCCQEPSPKESESKEDEINGPFVAMSRPGSSNIRFHRSGIQIEMEIQIDEQTNINGWCCLLNLKQNSL